jgi:hypothetical protein
MKPLTPIDCDLRDFPFLPLDVVRLRDSDISALSSGDEFRCAVLLWCASWHQVPAASLPDDDVVLANLAGFGRVIREWKKVKEGSLRGWIKCDDGRLYHPVVAEKALSAWQSKLERMWRTECARIKKYNQRHEENQLPSPEFEQFLIERNMQIVPEDIKDISQGQKDIVPEDKPPMSPEKHHPRERDRDTERDRDRDNIKPSVIDTQSSTSSGQVCASIKRLGIVDVNPANPTLQILIHAGATLDEFKNAAQIAVQKQNLKFNYVIGIVKGQRQDAANLEVHKGPMPQQTNYRDAGRNVAAKSIFKPEHTQHLQGNTKPIEIDITEDKNAQLE